MFARTCGRKLDALVCALLVMLAITPVAGAQTNVSATVTVLPPGEYLAVSPVRLGDIFTRPSQNLVPVLAFRLDNRFATTKSIDAITLRDDSRGPGTQGQRLANVDSVSLYLDRDGDYAISGADSLLAVAEYTAAILPLSFSQLDMDPDSGLTFIAVVRASAFPRDSDSLDLYLLRTTDALTTDSIVPLGPDSVNSFGYNVFDGMTAGQLAVINSGGSNIAPADSTYHVFTLDVPRNGYSEDTLQILSVANQGTAGAADFDSLILYRDEGNGNWGGTTEEIRLGALKFTGGLWSLSGLAEPLTTPGTRLYLGARLSSYPANGATLNFAVPTSGLQVSSGNDGPIDLGVASADTFVIQSTEALFASTTPLAARVLIPGTMAEPLLGLELQNSYATPVVVDSIRCLLIASDPSGATQTQLDGQIDSVLLYLDGDGDPTTVDSLDTLVGTAQITGGQALFTGLGMTVPPGGAVRYLSVGTAVSASGAKNANPVNFAVNDAADLYTTPAATVTGAYPLQNPSDHTIDAFPSGRVGLTPVPGTSLFGGQIDQVMMQFDLPANGYAVDSLFSIALVNSGSLAQPENAVTLRLWHDVTRDGFTLDDAPLGSFTYSGSAWDLDNLDHLIGPGGLALIVTSDIAATPFEGGTARLQIPVDGIRYVSGTDGPDDLAITNPDEHLILPPNRVTAVSIPLPTVTIAPASQATEMLTFALYNGYVGQSKTVTGMRLTNSSHTRSASGWEDIELGQISLYLDQNGNRIFDGDSLLATGYFSGGVLQLSGVNVPLAPESLAYLFVTADIARDVIDSDSLSLAIETPADLQFTDAVILNGDLPLTTGGHRIIDGSVREQFELLALPARTLKPGDTDVTVLAFRPPINGDQIDTLQALRIVNLQDADATDISGLELWLDRNGNDTWEPTDSLVDALTYTGSDWTRSGLDLEMSTPAAALFVVAAVDLAANPGRVFQAGVPLLGCTYASDNDGPRDLFLDGGQAFTISASGLRIAQTPLSATYSIGQPITVRATVTNVLPTSMDSVLGTLVFVDNPFTVTLDSAAIGPVNLGPGGSVDFVWYYTAAQAGTTFWRLRADAPAVPDTSAVLQTGTVTIQSPSSPVVVELINSIPTAVARGQSNVFPLSIRYEHPDTDPSAASIRLDSIQLRVDDGAGSPIAANTVFRRLVLATGAMPVAIVSSVPAQPDVWLPFVTPVTVAPGATENYSLLVDIDSTAAANNFALSLVAAASVPLVDANTLQPVPIDAGVAFPLTTASCRIDDPSALMAVSYQPLLQPAVNVGQQNVEVVKLYLRHPGPAGSSQMQLSTLRLEFEDITGTSLTTSDLFSQVQIVRQQAVIGRLAAHQFDSTSADIALDLPITLSPFEMDSVQVVVDITAFPPEPSFELVIDDSTSFGIRDLSSGLPLEAGTDTALTTALVFPIQSGRTTFQQPAMASQVCLSSNLPASVLSGADSLALIDLELTQPGGVGYSGVRVRSLSVQLQDSLGNILDPNHLLDQVGVSLAPGTVQYQPFVQTAAGTARFDMTDTGVFISPGDTVHVTLMCDLEADALYDHFAVHVLTGTAFDNVDAVDSNRTVSVLPTPGCATGIPYQTSYTQIFLPAGRPLLTPESWPLQVAFPGQLDLHAFQSTLSYVGQTPQADLGIRSVRGRLWQRTGAGQATAPAAQVFSAVHFAIDDVVIATDSILSGVDIQLDLPATYDLTFGQSLNVEVRCDIRPNATRGNYLIEFVDSLFIDIVESNQAQPIHPLLTGGNYPLWSAELSVTDADLQRSFSNYPNPFVPSRGELTTLAYVLAEDASLDIEVFTTTGNPVRTILTDGFRAAGSYSDLIWAGRNDAGVQVAPGAYLCKVTAHYSSGRVESFTRRIAVVR